MRFLTTLRGTLLDGSDVHLRKNTSICQSSSKDVKLLARSIQDKIALNNFKNQRRKDLQSTLIGEYVDEELAKSENRANESLATCSYEITKTPPE